MAPPGTRNSLHSSDGARQQVDVCSPPATVPRWTGGPGYHLAIDDGLPRQAIQHDLAPELRVWAGLELATHLLLCREQALDRHGRDGLAGWGDAELGEAPADAFRRRGRGDVIGTPALDDRPAE